MPMITLRVQDQKALHHPADRHSRGPQQYRNTVTLFTLVTAFLFIAVTFTSAEDKPAVHLILLSGQSNMANLDPERVFIPELEKHFGAENLVVVKVARNGQPIRRWYKKWNVNADRNRVESGDLYDQLMKETAKAMSGKSIKSVTLIWMQGERDAKEHLSDRYEEAFMGILDQVKSDLRVKEIHTIIGRLSDSGVGDKDWDQIRAIQQKLGESGPRSAWINTDDLNDGDNGKNNLHYSKAGYDLLAKRYVEKVKELLK
jgi:Carbohydrate esterase, sialic acid-specific acetylesterase